MLSNWYTIETANGASLDAPGIYVWCIDGQPIYAGKSIRLSSRLQEYGRNVQRMEAGQAYHIAGRGFRAVHGQLSDAKRCGFQIRAVVVENCARSEINVRERYWIKRLTDGHFDLRS